VLTGASRGGIEVTIAAGIIAAISAICGLIAAYFKFKSSGASQDDIAAAQKDSDDFKKTRDTTNLGNL